MLWWRVPVGVVVRMTVMSSGRWLVVVVQPGVSLVWLQRSQRPWALSGVVGPPLACRVAWSMCLMGAPQ